jgi:hypothetical protein
LKPASGWLNLPDNPEAMRSFTRLVAILISIILLGVLPAACSEPVPELEIGFPGTAITPETAATATLPATQAATPETNPSPVPPPTVETTPGGSQTDAQPRTRYQLTAVLNYAQHYLVVDEVIHYTNRQEQPLPELLLMVDPLYYPGVFNLKSFSWQDGQPVVDYTIETGQIRVGLPEPLAPGASISFSLSYELNLPSPTPSAAVRPIPFGYTARQVNLVDWYPFIPPYLPGEGWQAHQAGFFGEHQVYELADFEVSLSLSDTGQDIHIAASAPARIEGDWHHYQHQAARNFAWSASPMYQVFSTTVGDTTILSYAFPDHTAAGEATLRTTAEALELYSELYAPYPRQLLSVVEADFLDGMEYDGLYFLSNGFYNLYQGRPDEYLITIAAHETAHQWFYAMVGNDQAIEPWLDEALCTYQERIFYEHLYPDALDWWWAYRVNYYNPRGWVDGTIYNPEGYRAYRDAIYLNGAVFLEELRLEIGEDVFFKFLKDYVDQTKDQIATGDDFFAVLEQHTQADLSALISKYFHLRGN